MSGSVWGRPKVSHSIRTTDDILVVDGDLLLQAVAPIVLICILMILLVFETKDTKNATP